MKGSEPEQHVMQEEEPLVLSDLEHAFQDSNLYPYASDVYHERRVTYALRFGGKRSMLSRTLS